MKKKFASLFLVMALVLTMIPASAFAGTEAITYTNTTKDRVIDDGSEAGFSNAWGVTLSSNKAEYTADENIYIKVEGAAAAGNGSWIGIFDTPAANTTTKSLVWAYTNMDNKTVTDVTDFIIYGPNATCFDFGSDYAECRTELKAGNTYYIMVFNDGRWAVLPIKIVGEPSVSTDLISTDKTTYKYKDPIKVTTNYQAGSSDWVGIYQAGQTPGSDMKSIAWYYVQGNESEFDITDFPSTHDKDVPAEQQSALWNGKLKAGEYSVKLFKNGSYTVEEEHTIVIEKEAYDSPDVVAAECEKAGYSRQWYTDGTYVDTPIDALEHVWSDWAFDAKTRTHSRTCSASEHEAQTGNCTGVPVGDPVIDENGMTTTYQCSVCKGEYTETVESGYEFVETVTVPATCEEDGETYDLWENAAGETMKLNVTPVPKTGHAYGGWTPVGDGTHKQVCANDENHVKTEDCATNAEFDGNKLVHTCTVCKDATSEVVISTDKKLYAVGEDITVKTDYPAVGANGKNWIGIFYMTDGGDDSEETDTPLYPNKPAKAWFYLTDNAMEFKVTDFVKHMAGGAENWSEFINAETGELLAGTWTVAIILDDASATGQVSPFYRFTICEHAYDRFEVLEEPTCTKDGLMEVTCHRCQDSYTEAIPAAHKWNDGVQTTAPTCKDAGVMTYTCTVDGCGVTKTEAIDKLAEHDWNAGDVTKAPTCKAAGEKTFVCGVCKATKTEAVAVDPNAHKEVTVPGKAASCTATGLTAGKKCELCEKVIVAQTEIAKVAHDSKVTIPGKAATCTAAGKTEGKACSVCGEVQVAQKEVAKLSHDFKVVSVTEATCEKGGQKTEKCANCPETRVAATAKKPHNYVAVAGKPATCTETGLTAGEKCEACGTWKVTQGVIDKVAHTVAASTVTKKATAKANGVITNTCACGEVVSTDVIAKPVVTLSKAGVVYTGKKVKAPVVRVKAGGKTVATANYTITKPKNVTKMKDIGRYVYTVKFKGEKYSGTVKVNFEIKPAKTKIKAPAAAKKAITVKWTKAAKKEKVTGYEVMYATNSKFTKGKKTVTVKGASKVSKKVTKLKSKTKYYVKVRSYKTVKGVKIYSDWSAVKSIKAK